MRQLRRRGQHRVTIVEPGHGDATMMDCSGMMMGGGMMIVGMGVIWLLIAVALLLAIAALIKYLRSGSS